MFQSSMKVSIRFMLVWNLIVEKIQVVMLIVRYRLVNSIVLLVEWRVLQQVFCNGRFMCRKDFRWVQMQILQFILMLMLRVIIGRVVIFMLMFSVVISVLLRIEVRISGRMMQRVVVKEWKVIMYMVVMQMYISIRMISLDCLIILLVVVLILVLLVVSWNCRLFLLFFVVKVCIVVIVWLRVLVLWLLRKISSGVSEQLVLQRLLVWVMELFSMFWLCDRVFYFRLFLFIFLIICLDMVIIEIVDCMFLVFFSFQVSLFMVVRVWWVEQFFGEVLIIIISMFELVEQLWMMKLLLRLQCELGCSFGVFWLRLLIFRCLLYQRLLLSISRVMVMDIGVIFGLVKFDSRCQNGCLCIVLFLLCCIVFLLMLMQEIVMGSRIRLVKMIIVMLIEVLMVSLWIILMLIISRVMKLMVLVRIVIIFGRNSWWKVSCVVISVLLVLLDCKVMLLIFCMLWEILMVKIRNGISIEQGLRLKLIRLSRLSCQSIVIRVVISMVMVLWMYLVNQYSRIRVISRQILKKLIIIISLLIRLLIFFVKLMMCIFMLGFCNWYLLWIFFFSLWENWWQLSLISLFWFFGFGYIFSSGMLMMFDLKLFVIRWLICLDLSMLLCSFFSVCGELLQVCGIILLLVKFFLVILVQCMLGFYNDFRLEWLMLGMQNILLWICWSVFMYFLVKMLLFIVFIEMCMVLLRLVRLLWCLSIFWMNGCFSGIIFLKLVDGCIWVVWQNRKMLISRQRKIIIGWLLKIRCLSRFVLFC